MDDSHSRGRLDSPRHLPSGPLHPARSTSALLTMVGARALHNTGPVTVHLRREYIACFPTTPHDPLLPP